MDELNSLFNWLFCGTTFSLLIIKTLNQMHALILSIQKHQRKYNSLLILVLCSFLCISCRKDYTCECTTIDSSGTFGTSVTSNVYNGKKKDVKNACESRSFISGTFSTSCKIK
jgi:hypothetical protein